ncbi:MAG: hypothetical protein JWN08_3505 [Frankiales bacterium]|nr:hypothetical protein [Frankiales bacterium]
MTSPTEPDVGTTFGRPGRASGVGDRRGLTAAGAVVFVLLLGLAGAAFDIATGSGLGNAFAVCFVVASALAALLVHREDLKAAVVMPPLTYVALALVGGALESTTATGSFLTKQALEIVNALVLGAPVLVAGTLAALLVAVVRGVRGRRG